VICCAAAVTGDEAVTVAATQRPALLLMDIQLPGMDGYEATRHIKADPALHHRRRSTLWRVFWFIV
jgi:CheY-like chemotaxis protein